jgi:hypothetical protein
MVHIIWKGKGWMVALTTFVCSLLAELVTLAITHDDNAYQTNPYPLAIALFLSGVLAFYINARVVTTGKNNNHSLFFIPIMYWGWILIVISIMVFFARQYGGQLS